MEMALMVKNAPSAQLVVIMNSNLDASGLAFLVISCNYPPSVSDVSVSMHAFRRV
jgi:hypothetical protein